MASYSKSDKEGSSQNKVADLVLKAEQDYVTGETLISKYVSISMYENINQIEAYINSKHISGNTDALGREKPFFNIVTAARNIWYRATDIDRKNIRFRATRAKQVLAAFLANVHLRDWMRMANFGAFLNEWGRTLATYGSAVTKWVEKEGKLYANVVPWPKLIVDAIDFDGNPKIEVLEMTEAQIRQHEGYDKDLVDKLCDALQVRTTMERQTRDTKNNYIKLYEIHGNMPLSYLTGEEKDDDTYVQQMHVITFVASKEKGKFDDYTLVKGRETKDPYRIAHLIKEDGQTLSIGAVQHLFEAQWMMNHTAKAIKDQLDLASKMIFQTADGNFVGQNALASMENGDILIHQPNMPVTQVNNTQANITALQSFGNQWKALSNEINGISEAMLGANPPAGSAWRQTEALLNESHSLFELMTENKGLYIEEMMRDFVIPFLKKKLNTTDEVSAVLEAHEIEKIDGKYVKNEAAKITSQQIVQAVIDGKPVSPEIQDMLLQANQSDIQGSLSELGAQRFFKPDELPDTTWKDVFKDFEWEVEVDITGEAAFSKEDLATLTTVLQTIGTNPTILQNPNAKTIFNKILSITGAMSPIELAEQTPTPPQPVAQPSV